MEKVCVVPGCNTRVSKDDRGVKSSMFCIPKRGKLNSQWIKVAPGITSLKPTFVLCEKHFSKEYVKEFIKKSNDGYLIAQSISNLVLDQLPTISKNSGTPSLLLQKNTEAKKLKERDSLDLSQLSANTEDFVSDLQPSERVAVGQAGKKDNGLQTHINNNNRKKRNVNNLSNTFEGSPKIKILQNVHLNNPGLPMRIPEEFVPLNENFVINDTLSDFTINLCTSPENEYNDREENFITTGNFRTNEDISKKSASLSKTYSVEHDYAVQDSPKPLFCTNATINIDSKSVELPKAWGVTEKTIQNKKYFLFMKAVTHVTEKQDTEVLQKYVLLDCIDRNASYFVYGHEIKNVTSLPETIHTADMLLRSLIMFEGMLVCEGLGQIDSSVQLPEVFRDSANILRHTKCTWILKTPIKMCIFCRTSKHFVSSGPNNPDPKDKVDIKSTDKVYHNKTFKVHHNNTDKVHHNNTDKVHHNNTDKVHHNNTDNVDHNGTDKVDHNSTDTVDCSDTKMPNNYNLFYKNTYFNRKIPSNQRLALKEILNAANYAPHGRRYSDEWLMFCISLSIRSRSAYEFLRKTNVIPLPNLRTVRKYFYGKKRRGTFDKTFVDLVKDYEGNATQQDSETLKQQNPFINLFKLDER